MVEFEFANKQPGQRHFFSIGEAFCFWGLDENDQLVSLVLDSHSTKSRKTKEIKQHLQPGWLEKKLQHPLLQKFGIEAYLTKQSGHLQLNYQGAKVASGELIEFRIMSGYDSAHLYQNDLNEYGRSVWASRFDLDCAIANTDSIVVEFTIVTGF